MKVVLFRDGNPGVLTRLPDENPEAGLGELLGGGRIRMTPITGRLSLVTRKEADRLELPVRYVLVRLGRVDLQISGDCAVVAVKRYEVLTDITAGDLRDAAERLRPVVLQ